MQLKPLVIALQGIGFGPLATALQGFVDAAEPIPPSPLKSPFFTPANGSPGSQITMRQMRKQRRKRRESQAFALGIL